MKSNRKPIIDTVPRPSAFRKAWITEGRNNLGLRDSETERDKPIRACPSPGAYQQMGNVVKVW